MKYISEYASVEYKTEENVVLLTWKKEAHIERYREPTIAALELLQEHAGSNFVVDARNGFEDDEKDVEWGFSYLLPEMAKTTCRFVCFIMKIYNGIESEMDMWTKEFAKYFAVTRSDSYDAAIASMKNVLYVNVRYLIQDGQRANFLSCMKREEIVEASRAEPGNISYEVLLPIENENIVSFNEMWVDADAQKRHGKTAHYQKLTRLKEQYVKDISICSYDVAPK